jgi:hypothetical protein
MPFRTQISFLFFAYILNWGLAESLLHFVQRLFPYFSLSLSCAKQERNFFVLVFLCSTFFIHIVCEHVNSFAFIFFSCCYMASLIWFCFHNEPNIKAKRQEEEGNKKAPLREEKGCGEAVFEWKEMAFDLLHQEGCKIFCLPT